jgi:hypothetical protein
MPKPYTTGWLGQFNILRVSASKDGIQIMHKHALKTNKTKGLLGSREAGIRSFDFISRFPHATKPVRTMTVGVKKILTGREE